MSSTVMAQPTTATTDLELAKQLGFALERCRNDGVQDRADQARKCLIMLDATREKSKILLRECDEMAAVGHKLLTAKLAATEVARLTAEQEAVRRWWEDPILIGSIAGGVGLAVGIVTTTLIVGAVR